MAPTPRLTHERPSSRGTPDAGCGASMASRARGVRRRDAARPPDHLASARHGRTQSLHRRRWTRLLGAGGPTYAAAQMSLFRRVTLYRIAPAQNPRENRLTEVTAALLERVEGLAFDVMDAVLASAATVANER